MLRTSTDAAAVRPASRASGRLTVPGDKSISHRYALLAALADGTSHIEGYSGGADCAATLACLGALGVTIRAAGPGAFDVEGRGLRGLQHAAAPLDAMNSGTTMRLLSGVVAAHPFRTIVGGDASLSRRPMRRIIEPLTRMGARIESVDGHPPLTIHGGDLHGITYSPDVPSAQVKSGVLLAGLQASGTTVVHEPAATRDHTERALHAFGVGVKTDKLRIEVVAGQRLRPARLRVPGDISSAAFWAALAAGTPGGNIEISGVGLNPTLTGVLHVLRRAGAEVVWTNESEGGGEPVGHLRVSYGTCRAFAIDPEEVPGVIDEIPALAALAVMMPDGEGLTVRGASELRVKESDRIASLAAGFRALGAEIQEFEDGFRVTSRPLTGGTANAAGDHRLAMAFAVAATRAAGPSSIAGASSVDVSYPGFFDELARLTAER